MERIKQIIVKKMQNGNTVMRFIFSGGTAALVNLISLYVFTEFAGLYYMVSVVISFLIAVCISFVLQKFWAFRDSDRAHIYKQARVYFFVAIFNTILNAGLVFLFVEGVNMHYMAGQFFVSGIIAIESFFIYKYVIFNKVY